MDEPPVNDPAANPPSPGEVTRLLEDLGQDDGSAAARLMPLVQRELRSIAERLFRRESPGHTLQPTALVHEAFMRLSAHAAGARPDGDGDDAAASAASTGPAASAAPWNDRDHFFAVAATAMRQVLVDHARRKRALKRSADGVRLPLDGIAEGAANQPDLLDLEHALVALESTRPRAAQVVQLRFFAGMTEEATARVLDISRKTAAADWAFARAWLARRLQGRDGPAAAP